jgi:hypothetical protein
LKTISFFLSRVFSLKPAQKDHNISFRCPRMTQYCIILVLIPVVQNTKLIKKKRVN